MTKRPKQRRYEIKLSAPKAFGTLSEDAVHARILVARQIMQRTDSKVFELAMQMIAAWTYVEHQWAVVLTALLDAEWDVVAEMWISLRTANTREAVFRAAADSRMADRPKDLELFKAVLGLLPPVARRRNMYVHHLWGWSPELPDRLCLVPPDLSVRNLVKRMHEVVKDRKFYEFFAEKNEEFKALDYAWDAVATLHGPQIQGIPTFDASDVKTDMFAAYRAADLVQAIGSIVSQGSQADESRQWLSGQLSR